MEDFYITLEKRNSANRNADIHEIAARKIIKDIMFDTKTQPFYNEQMKT
jgi:hypothetical protein